MYKLDTDKWLHISVRENPLNNQLATINDVSIGSLCLFDFD